MTILFSQNFDDKKYALLKRRKNDAFLCLQIKATKSKLYQYCFDKSLIKFVFKFELRMNVKSAFNLKIIYQILIFLYNYNANKKLL